MVYAKPVLLFLLGAVMASAFFLFDLDRFVPRGMRFWRAEPLALAIVPSGVSAADGCPVGYAIDNRTDRPVFFTLNDEAAPPLPPDRDAARWDRYRSRVGSYRPHFSPAGMSEFEDTATPASAEPGVRQSEEAYPDDSNYGGSSPEYGSDGQRFDRVFGSPDTDADDVDANNDSAGAYDQTDAGQYGAVPPPPAGRPFPFAPPGNSSPYGAPNPPSYGSPSYEPPSYNPANRVRPGEIAFLPPGDSEVSPECGGRSTVTLQLSE